MIRINNDVFARFDVIGKDKSGKRFKKSYSGDYEGYKTSIMINMWSGRVWGVKQDGKRKIIKIIFN